MRTYRATLCMLLLWTSVSFGQTNPVSLGRIDPSAVPALHQHYQEEFTSDRPQDTLRWQAETRGLHVSFASSDETYYRSEVPQLPEGETRSCQIAGWKGERLNAVILIWSPDTLAQVRLAASDLVDAQGNRIGKAHVRLAKVQYVVSNYPYAAKDITCGESSYKELYLLPDRLTPLSGLDRFDVPGRTTRPVWLSVDVPAQTKEGIYEGTIEIATESSRARLSLSVKVQRETLPKPQDWKYRLDLWQNPYAVALYYNLKPWSDEHFEALKSHVRLYADAGGKFITTYAVHSPWSDNSYMIEGGMVEWIKRKNDAWKFDYTVFDRYVQLAVDAGVDEAITIYTPIPWGNRFRYLDEETGNYVVVAWAPETPEFKSVWTIFLNDLKEHLAKKGWLKKTYLGINENELSQTLAAIKVIRENDKRWKITYAGDWHPELDTLLDDYSCVYGKEPAPADLERRAARGATSSYYICCTPAKPNTFISSPPVEGRFLGWYAAACRYDGFLRWAYDAWPQDPMRDARHTYWAAGDCFMVYPGAGSSIRFEKMREGIVDFEKIRILKEMAMATKAQGNSEQLKDLQQHLDAIAAKNDSDALYYSNAVSRGKKILEALSDHTSR